MKLILIRVGVAALLIALLVFFYNLLTQDHPEIHAILFLPAIVIMLVGFTIDYLFPHKNPRKRRH